MDIDPSECRAAQYYWPLTAEGQPKFRQRRGEGSGRSSRSWTRKGKPTFNQVPVGDMDKFLEIAGVLSLTTFRLARFQSPTLQAIAVAQQQAQSWEPIHFKVHIRNAQGEHLMTTIDGEVVDGGQPGHEAYRKRWPWISGPAVRPPYA